MAQGRITNFDWEIEDVTRGFEQDPKLIVSWVFENNGSQTFTDEFVVSTSPDPTDHHLPGSYRRSTDSKSIGAGESLGMEVILDSVEDLQAGERRVWVYPKSWPPESRVLKRISIPEDALPSEVQIGCDHDPATGTVDVEIVNERRWNITPGSMQIQVLVDGQVVHERGEGFFGNSKTSFSASYDPSSVSDPTVRVKVPSVTWADGKSGSFSKTCGGSGGGTGGTGGDDGGGGSGSDPGTGSGGSGGSVRDLLDKIKQRPSLLGLVAAVGLILVI